jgi:hypothetical protein
MDLLVIIYLITKRYLNVEVNCTEPFPSISTPWLNPMLSLSMFRPSFQIFIYPERLAKDKDTSGLYYKPTTIVNEDSRVYNKIKTSLTDDARAVIYDHHMFIVQATVYFVLLRQRRKKITISTPGKTS